MKEDIQVKNLFDVINDLENSLRWLRRSFKLCHGITDFSKCSDEQYDAVEAFMSRFSRTSDILIKKVFRAIDAVELEQSGSLIDSANRAEKRGIIDSVSTIRIIREARNLVAHEYASGNMQELFDTTTELTPTLMDICDKAIKYCQRYEI